jgi:hypothetical protein
MFVASDLIGFRADGRPIHLLGGASGPEGEPPATDPGAGATPPVPTPPPAPAQPPAAGKGQGGWTPPTQAEWEAAQVAAQRLAQLQQALPVEDDGEEGDGEEENEAPPTPRQTDRSKAPTWEDFDRLMAAQRKAAGDARKNRERLRNQTREWETADAQRQAELARQTEIAAAAEVARQEAESLYRPATVRAAAVPAFVQAGARPDRVDDLFEKIRQTELKVNGHKVDGIDQQVAALKNRYPEWFTPAQPDEPQRRAPRVTQGDRQPPEPDKPSRTADLLAQHILSGGDA